MQEIDYYEDSVEAPSQGESDDNTEYVESNAMRMNAASALTFGPNRSGVKDATGKIFFFNISCLNLPLFQYKLFVSNKKSKDTKM